jgi:uncharacterized protein (DUF2062 family)
VPRKEATVFKKQVSAAPKAQKGFGPRLHLWWRKMIRSVLIINDTPHRVALGIAIGTFVAYQPIVGIQMITGALIAFLARANVTATLPPAWITNPVTIVPIYLGLHWIGNIFLGGPSLTMEELGGHLKTFNETSGEQGLWAAATWAFRELLETIIYPMAIGGAIVGILNGIVFYWLTLRAVATYQKGKIRKRLKWINQGKPNQLSGVNTSL